MDPANPRTLEQILSQLAPSYDPAIQSAQAQQAALPGFQASQLQGLDYAKNNAFGDILNGARARGIGFSGIPEGEQAKYIGATYIPAVSQINQQFSDKNFSLSDAINSLNLDRTKTANSIYDTEQGQYQQYIAAQRAAEAQQRAAAAASGGYSFGGGTSAGIPTAQAAGTAAAPKGVRNTDGTHAFLDAAGNPISAAVYYAQITNGQGTNFRGFLQDLAKDGDKGAAAALGFVGNDYGYDPSKINSQQLANLYNSLVWGAPNIAQASYKAPAAKSTYTNPFNTLTNTLQRNVYPVT